MDLTIILPTYNEEEAIGETISQIKNLNIPNARILVVDSGSKDKTVEIARKKGVDVLELPIRGKAIAIKHAIEKIDTDYVIMIDSDLSYPADRIPTMLKKLEDGCDVVIGTRFETKMEPGAMTKLNYHGNKMLTSIANITYGTKIHDVCSGFWGFRKSAYKKIKINSKHFELEANLFVQTVKNRLRVCEIPIKYCKRTGTTKLSPLHGINIGIYLIKGRFL